MVLMGQKKTEYIEINEASVKMLFNQTQSGLIYEDFINAFKNDLPYSKALIKYFKGFNNITFKCEEKSFTIELQSFSINTGRNEWGAIPGVRYFCFNLGVVIIK